MPECKICDENFEIIHWSHLRKHNISLEEYKEKFSDAKVGNEGSSNPMYGIDRDGFWDKREHPQKGKKYEKIYGKKKGSELRKKRRKEMMSKKNPAKNPKVRKKISDAKKGQKKSEEHKRKIGNTMKKYWKNNVHPMKGKTHSKFVRKKLAKKTKAFAKNNPERMKKWSNEMKKKWKSDSYVKKVQKGWNGRPTSLEKKAKTILKQLFGDYFEYVGNGERWIGRKNPDFLDKNREIIIEVFARYWKELNGSIEEYKKRRKKHFSQYGYTVLFFNEDEVSFEIMFKKIRPLLRAGATVALPELQDNEPTSTGDAS